MNIIEKIKIYREIAPDLEKLGELKTMSLTWPAVLMATDALGSLLTHLMNIAAPEAQPWIHAASLIVAAIAVVGAHYKNPDGTSARTAWTPEKK